MRDVNRIDRILTKIKGLWINGGPDQRFFQMLSNMLAAFGRNLDESMYHVEDDTLEDWLGGDAGAIALVPHEFWRTANGERTEVRYLRASHLLNILIHSANNGYAFPRAVVAECVKRNLLCRLGDAYAAPETVFNGVPGKDLEHLDIISAYLPQDEPDTDQPVWVRPTGYQGAPLSGGMMYGPSGDGIPIRVSNWSTPERLVDDTNPTRF